MHAITSAPASGDGGLTELAELILTEDRDTRGTVASINSIVYEAGDLARESKSFLNVTVFLS